MKKMIVFAIIILVIAGVLIGKSTQVSSYIENISIEKLSEPDLEKSSYYNIKYVDFIGNFEKTLDLIDKFKLRYKDKSKYLPEMILMTADIYENRIEMAKVREVLEYYIAEYPDAKNINDVKQRYAQSKSSF